LRRARPAPQIGVGKSTLLKRLRKQLADNSAVTFVDEPVEIWEAAGLLAAMYDGTLSHAAFQLTALTTRYAALAHALKVPGVELVIAERSLGSDRRVFAHTHLGELEFRAYAAAPPRRRAAA
jgi:thymidylate kinase